MVSAAAQIAPTFAFPRRDRIIEDVRLAACLAQQPVARLNALLAHSPSRRGPTHDLSGAVAALNLMATSTGPNNLNAAMAALCSGRAATRWALGHPGDTDYKRVHTVCGRPPARAGHDPQLMLLANRDLVRAIGALRNPDGTATHPRFGEVGIVDATAGPGVRFVARAADAHHRFDTEQTCRTLADDYSLQPVFTRVTKRVATRTVRGGRTVRVVDGQPECPCGAMKLHRREGFYTAADRLSDGLLRGQKAPDVKVARLRWRCPNDLHEEVSLYHKDDPANHTYWPRTYTHPTGVTRRAFELSRQQVESVFSQVKLCGIGATSRDSLWARDTGTQWLLGLHYVLRAAWALASSTGDYKTLEAEYRILGLHKAGIAPTATQLQHGRATRPRALNWSWPEPGSRIHSVPLAA